MIGIASVGFFASSGGRTSFDTDAQAFFTANSTLTDTAQKNAINQFALNLKTNGLWTLGVFLNFGFLGDSTRVKYNFFSPLDLNSSYRLSFSSGFTFSVQGIQGNGVSSYIRTYFTPSNVFDINHGTYGFYSRTNKLRPEADMGAYLIGPSITGFHTDGPGNNQYYEVNTHNWYNAHLNNINTSGNHLVTRTSSANARAFRNGVKIQTNTAPTNINQTNEIYLASMNGLGYSSSKQYTLFYCFDGLSDSQAVLLDNCIQTLMTTLGLNV